MKKICIVTTRHISYNPRVLKEADALDAAGYEVVVVTIRNNEWQATFDDELMAQRKWTLRTVKFRRERSEERRYWLYLSLKQRLFLVLSKITLRGGVAERVIEKGFDGLRMLARAERADLYIAHHTEALGAAYAAAKYNKARLGFDAEDFHSGMDNDPWVNGVLAHLEAKYLPFCQYLTAASKGIGEAYHGRHGIPMPLVILNVFPLENLPVGKPGNPVRFYWASQVIGPNRGIEVLLEAARRISTGTGSSVGDDRDGGRGSDGNGGGAGRADFEIHLRGQLHSEAYKDKMKQICGDGGLWERIFLHEPILAARLIGDANQYDVGLVLEAATSVNRNVCVANKVFSYLMSRLFIIGTDTYGQKDIFTHFPDAVRMVRMDNVEDLAEAMSYCLTDEGRLLLGKQAAGRAAEGSYNWEMESTKLRTYVNTILTS